MSKNLTMMMMYYLLLNYGSTPTQEPPIPMNVLKAEYDLIQRKVSKLSANQRRAVVFEYERRLSKEEES